MHALKRVTNVIGAVALSTGLVAGYVGVTAPAGAQSVPTVTDYAAYPSSLPTGCPDGADALVDVTFTDAAGTTASELRQLDLLNSEAVAMSWAGYHEACTADGSALIDVTLVDYESAEPSFDVGEDQQLIGATTCGPSSTPCAEVDGRYRLAFTMPAMEVSCVGQFDAILGLPLQVVGPSGSYYSTALRGSGPTMLVSSTGWDTRPCVPPAPAPAAVAAQQVEATTTTTAPPPPPPTTPPPAIAVQPAQLAFTGSNATGPLAAFAVGLLGFGVALLALGRRMAPTPGR